MFYDRQASRYDERAAVPDDASRAVAASIDRIAGLAPGRRLLEIGAGTGLVTLPLLDYPIDYRGFDSSSAMLERFGAKIEARGLRAELVVADGNERWPADDASIDLVVSTRALHHIDPAHAVSELLRVMRPGGWLVLGTVRRPQDSVKSQMRRRMRELLRERGIDGRSHDVTTAHVFAALEARGARRGDPVVAARWSVEHRPIDSIDAWQGKDGLAGNAIDTSIKRDVLEELRVWAVGRYGAIDQSLVQEEWFELNTLQFSNE